MNSSQSKKLFKRSLKIIPGGVNSPVRSFSGVDGQPLFINKGDGAYLWDVDGNKYIDFVSSWGPMILGHAHPEVVEAIKKTTDYGSSFGAPTEKELELAEIIVNRVPGCSMVRLVNSGTEAAMSVLRLARGYTGRDKVIKFNGGYHGHADSFLIEAGSGSVTLGVPNSYGVTQGVVNDTLIGTFNDIDSVKCLFDNYNDEIAAVIVEPVNGNSGCIPPNDYFLKSLKELCKKNQALLIFDEVITGFRIAYGGASEYYNVTPDLYAFGKIIGGGLPIGAYGGSKNIMEFVSPVGPVYQAGTLSGNPLAVSAGIATLKSLNKNSYTNLEEVSAYFETAINKFINEFSYPLSINRVGSMLSLFFCKGPVYCSDDLGKYSRNDFISFFHSLLNQGTYFPPSQFETVFMSLAHTKEIVDLSIVHISKALSKIFIDKKIG